MKKGSEGEFVMKTRPILYIVVPCYNEEEVLPFTSGMFLDKLNSLIYQKQISDSSRVMFVNDGSKDNYMEYYL